MSLTPHSWASQCHWCCYVELRSVMDTAELSSAAWRTPQRLYIFETSCTNISAKILSRVQGIWLQFRGDIRIKSVPTFWPDRAWHHEVEDTGEAEFFETWNHANYKWASLHYICAYILVCCSFFKEKAKENIVMIYFNIIIDMSILYSAFATIAIKWKLKRNIYVIKYNHKARVKITNCYNILINGFHFD